MTATTLRLEADPGVQVDMTGVTPERLAGLAEPAIAVLPLLVGNRRVPLGELFRVVAADGDEARLVIEGSTRRLDRLGAGMASGRLQVYGDTGAYLGLGLHGGRVSVFGAAGDFAAAAMRDGLLEVRGGAGAFLGAALPGAAHGMAGGAVVVGGDAGDRLGDRMRRGVVAVQGGAGAYLASRALGGTVLLGGTHGPWPGYGMRRGTVVVGSPAGDGPHPLFADNGAHDLPWLALLGRHLAGLGWDGAPVPRRVRRLTGDLTAGGRGEILLAEPR